MSNVIIIHERITETKLTRSANFVTRVSIVLIFCVVVSPDLYAQDLLTTADFDAGVEQIFSMIFYIGLFISWAMGFQSGLAR